MMIKSGKRSRQASTDEGRPDEPISEGQRSATAEPPTSSPAAEYSRTAEGGESVAATVWQRNKRITGLWSKNEPRNSWISIAGLGWRKLANTSDSGVMALTILASQAISTARPVDCREESDGMIHEIYLW